MPDVKEKLAARGGEVLANSTEDFTTLVKAEVLKWSDVVTKSGATVD